MRSELILTKGPQLFLLLGGTIKELDLSKSNPTVEVMHGEWKMPFDPPVLLKLDPAKHATLCKFLKRFAVEVNA